MMQDKPSGSGPSANTHNPVDDEIKFSSLSIRRRLAWLAFLIIIVLTALFSIVILQKVRDETRLNLANILNSKIETTHKALLIWQRGVKGDIVHWTLSPDIINSTKELLNVPHTPEALWSSLEVNKLQAIFRPILESHPYLGFIIVAPDYTNLASMLVVNIGQKNILAAQDNFLERVFAGEILVSNPIISDVPLPDASGQLVEGYPTMFAAAPIRDGGKVIAALALRFNPAESFSHFTQLGYRGASGETYAFDRQGRFLSESRFAHHLRAIGLLQVGKPVILNVELRDPGGNMLEGFKPSLPRDKQPLTRMAAEAAAGKNGHNLDGYRDYRGVNVVGAWIWSKDLNLGLATEIDTSEAYRSYFLLRTTIISALVFTILLFLSFTLVLETDRRKTLQLAEKILESEARGRNILVNLVDGIILIDENGIVKTFNPAAERIFGYAAAEIIGQSVNILMPSPYNREHDGYMKRYLDTGEAHIIGIGREVSGLRKDGSIFPLDLSVSEIRFKNRRLFTGIVRDITEQNEMRLALQEAHDTLEKQVEERTTKLNAANEELKSFAYIVSHDLRAPLVNIKGFSEELRSALETVKKIITPALPLGTDRLQLGESENKKLLAALKEDAPEALNFISSSIARMDNMIGSILKLSRIGHRELNMQPVNMTSIVQSVLKSLAYEIQGKHIMVTVSKLPVVIADSISMEQIMGNLLSNAVKYIQPDRPGLIEISGEQSEAESLFTIRDNGRGIAPNDIEKIFDLFRRAGKQDVPGEGIGLTYIRTLVKRHGGKVWCESELGAGSTFFFTISQNTRKAGER